MCSQDIVLTNASPLFRHLYLLNIFVHYTQECPLHFSISENRKHISACCQSCPSHNNPHLLLEGVSEYAAVASIPTNYLFIITLRTTWLQSLKIHKNKNTIRN
jgi:hypothetical protein